MVAARNATLRRSAMARVLFLLVALSGLWSHGALAANAAEEAALKEMSAGILPDEIKDDAVSSFKDMYKGYKITELKYSRPSLMLFNHERAEVDFRVSAENLSDPSDKISQCYSALYQYLTPILVAKVLDFTCGNTTEDLLPLLLKPYNPPPPPPKKHKK
jgi:hypothetical protein